MANLCDNPCKIISIYLFHLLKCSKCFNNFKIKKKKKYFLLLFHFLHHLLSLGQSKWFIFFAVALIKSLFFPYILFVLFLFMRCKLRLKCTQCKSFFLCFCWGFCICRNEIQSVVYFSLLFMYFVVAHSQSKKAEQKKWWYFLLFLYFNRWIINSIPCIRCCDVVIWN